MMTLHEMELAELSPIQKTHYERCLKNGSAPKLALMLATRHGPEMTGSDRAFNEGQNRKMSNLPFMNKTMLSIAQKAGINTAGKFHVSALGRYDNPLAWCSTIEDARKSAQMQNLNTHGLIKNKAVEMPPVAPVALAADIVDAEVARRLSQPEHSTSLPREPKKRASAVAALRESVIAEHGKQRRASGRASSPGRRLLASVAASRLQR